MASTTEPIGKAEECNIELFEDDTEDFVVHLNNADGTNATVEDWTADLVVSDSKHGPLTSAGVNTWPGAIFLAATTTVSRLATALSLSLSTTRP